VEEGVGKEKEDKEKAREKARAKEGEKVMEKEREQAREKEREKAGEKAREKKAREKKVKKGKKVKMKSEKKKVVEKRLGSKGEGRLSFTAEAPSPTQPAGRGGKPLSNDRYQPARAAWSRGSLTPAAGWPLLQQEQHRRLRWERTAPPEAGRRPPMSWRTRTATATG